MSYDQLEKTEIDKENQTVEFWAHIRDILKKLLDVFDDFFGVIRNMVKIMSQFVVQMIVGCCVFVLHGFEMSIAANALWQEYKRDKRNENEGGPALGNLDEEETEWRDTNYLTVQDIILQREKDRLANYIAQSMRLFLTTAGLGLAGTMIVLLAIGASYSFMIFLLPMSYCCLAASFLVKMFHARHKYDVAHESLRADRKKEFYHACVEFLGSVCVATGFVIITGLVGFVPPLAGFVLIITGVTIATTNSIVEFVEWLNKPQQAEKRQQVIDFAHRFIIYSGIVLGATTILLANLGLVSTTVLLTLGSIGVALTVAPYLYALVQYLCDLYSRGKSNYFVPKTEILALLLGVTAVVLPLIGGFPWFITAGFVLGTVVMALWPKLSQLCGFNADSNSSNKPKSVGSIFPHKGDEQSDSISSPSPIKYNHTFSSENSPSNSAENSSQTLMHGGRSSVLNSMVQFDASAAQLADEASSEHGQEGQQDATPTIIHTTPVDLASTTSTSTPAPGNYGPGSSRLMPIAPPTLSAVKRHAEEAVLLAGADSSSSSQSELVYT